MELKEQKKTILSGMSLDELQSFCLENNETKFRAKQLFDWLYKKCVIDFDDMTNLSKGFREKLKEIALITTTKIKERHISSDGTIKYLLEFEDGNVVETVLMRFDNRANLTACVSCQVGCAVGCVFCATGKNGLVRNLSYKEIVEQVLIIQRDTGLKVTNIVYMGQGEPLLNYDNVIGSINFINSNMEIGIRRITVSTSGIVPKIREIANENRQLSLAISLHAPNSKLRKSLMPIESKYDIDSLVDALKFHNNKTGRRITIEYVLIKGVNDSPECARDLAILLGDIKYNVNLIPYNPVCDDKFAKPSMETISTFKYILENAGKAVTVRLERGADILAACGQLTGL